MHSLHVLAFMVAPLASAVRFMTRHRNAFRRRKEDEMYNVLCHTPKHMLSVQRCCCFRSVSVVSVFAVVAVVYVVVV